MKVCSSVLPNLMIILCSGADIILQMPGDTLSNQKLSYTDKHRRVFLRHKSKLFSWVRHSTSEPRSTLPPILG